MVRLKDNLDNGTYDLSLVSIPKMVRLKETSTEAMVSVQLRFNSKNGAIKSENSLSTWYSTLLFQFQKWCD